MSEPGNSRLLTNEQRRELEAMLLWRRDQIRRRLLDPEAPVLEPGGDPMDEASERTAAAELGGVARNDAHTLGEIDAALTRLALGTYGISEETGEPIPYERLRAMPWARRQASEQERREADPPPF